jgi:hypothetical protein
MEDKVIPFEQHQKVVDEMRNEFESTLEEGFDEAFTMLKESQEEIKIEREKSEIYQTIARIERISSFECLKPIQGQLKGLIQGLYNSADNLGRKRSKGYPVTKVAAHKPKMANEMEDNIRPEYDLKSLKRKAGDHMTSNSGVSTVQWDGMGHGPDLEIPSMQFPSLYDCVGHQTKELKQEIYGEKERNDV